MSLTILFAAGGQPAPLLPEIHVRDTLTLVDIPVACIQGQDEDYIQTTTIGFAPLAFSTAEVLAAGARSEEYWTRRLSKLLLNGRFSASGANAVVRVLFFDTNSVKALSESFTLNATAFQDGSDYIAEIVEVGTMGAKKVAVEVISVSAGTFSLLLAGV